MKYLIMVYSSQLDYDAMTGRPAGPDKPAWSPADLEALGAFMESFTKDLADSGELVATHGLTPPVQARRLRLQDGVSVVTDGPYPETQEVLAGFWIVDCASFDRATEIASRLAKCPNPGGAYENSYADVRPILESRSDLEL
jgi:hypothetical protein